MIGFTVWLDAIGTPVWVFCNLGCESFPDDFQSFDTSLNKSSVVVWVIDTTQALIAYDWLVERGWTYDAESCCNNEFTDLLARCGVC